MLERLALSVNDPDSSDYGHFFSRDEVNSMAAPADEDVAVVDAFLRSARRQHPMGNREGSCAIYLLGEVH